MKVAVYSELLDKIVDVYEGYSNVLRGTTQPYYHQKIKRLLPNLEYRPDGELYRETLMEHVGSLPIVASTIYPYVNDSEVDLGHALLLLSIHDIGELATGDEITFLKNKDKPKTGLNEVDEAIKLLDPYYHDLYLEIEEKKTKTAKFAKSIDKITPDILDYINPPEITVSRYKDLMKRSPKEIVPLIKEYKHPYMIWNDFLKDFHLYLLDKINQKLKHFY